MHLHCNSSKDPGCTLLVRRVPTPKRIVRRKPKKRQRREREREREREKCREFKETCAGQ
jgi:hypothetical protein